MLAEDRVAAEVGLGEQQRHRSRRRRRRGRSRSRGRGCRRSGRSRRSSRPCTARLPDRARRAPRRAGSDLGVERRRSASDRAMPAMPTTSHLARRRGARAAASGSADEQPPRPAAPRELQQRVDAAGEVVAVEGGRSPASDPSGTAVSTHGPEASRSRGGAPPMLPAPRRRDSPRSADAHASRMLATPAATPSGWPWMPPPASTRRSVVPTAAYVAWASPPHWPDESTGTVGVEPEQRRRGRRRSRRARRRRTRRTCC